MAGYMLLGAWLTILIILNVFSIGSHHDGSDMAFHAFTLVASIITSIMIGAHFL